jgi:hypothetical protein
LILEFGTFLGFLTQTVAGFSAGLFALPILLLVVDLQEASALLAPLFLAFSAFYMVKEWAATDKHALFELGLGTTVGMIIGVYLLKGAEPQILQRVLGGLILAYVLYRLTQRSHIALFERLGLLFGLIGGIVTGLYSAGGTFYVIYLHNKFEKGSVIRATVMGVLGLANIIRIPLLLQTKILTPESLRRSLLVLPAFLLGLYAGEKLYAQLNNTLFRRVLLALLTIAGASLLLR